jgi:hypothetical protein
MEVTQGPTQIFTDQRRIENVGEKSSNVESRG